jgi:hypothetical protein
MKCLRCEAAVAEAASDGKGGVCCPFCGAYALVYPSGEESDAKSEDKYVTFDLPYPVDKDKLDELLQLAKEAKDKNKKIKIDEPPVMCYAISFDDINKKW